MNSQPGIAIIGPILIDNKSSGGEGEKLYQKLKQQGYTVYKKSGYRNKLIRLADTLWFIAFNHRKIDVIIGLVFSGRAFILEYLVFVLARMLNIRVIGVLHGGALNHFYKKYPNMVTSLYNKCNLLATPSMYLQHYFNAKGWPIKYLPNFIDSTLFPFNWEVSATPKLLWVRAFHDIYNPELAIKCVHHLKKKFPAVKLTMVGPDKGLLDACTKLINELDVSENIDIIGYVPNKELNSYYKSHQVFITTTRYESFGVALVEAACTGIPMVSTSVGEIPYMWKADAEMLIAENETDFFIKTELLLHDESLRIQLSANARQKAQKYTWEHIKSEWDNVLKS